MGSLWIQTIRLNPSKPSSQESRGFNHGSVNGYTQGHDDALALAIGIEQAISATPLTPDEIERLALVLWEHNGERPIVYESGKRIADRELEWWKQVAVSAWGFINGTEKEQ